MRAQARVRAWWRLVPRVLTRPTEVFVALRNDDETDVDARSEPILAIVIVAGMAAMLLTPAWGTLLDEESLDWIVLAVVTFIGGLLLRLRRLFPARLRRLARGSWRRPRDAGDGRHGSSSGSPRFRSRSRSWSRLPAIVLAFGYDWFRTGGSDEGAGRAIVLVFAFASRALVARAGRRRPRTTFELPWRGVIGALALAIVLIATLAVLPRVI